ncbi:MAG: GTP-binding protein [Nanoarchaeota archaeon]
MGSQEQLREIEEQIKKTKYNKHTQYGIGLLKAKLSRIREDIQHKSASKKGEGYSVKKTGDATVILLGFPSVGKSTLLNQLTGTSSAVAAYDFTTLDVIPGLLNYKHAQIQILDMPGIVSGAASGRGRGKEVLGVLRSADLILVVVDALKTEQYSSILSELFESGIRVNQHKPDVTITKKARGGISVATTIPTRHIDKKTVTGILREYHLNNCDVVIREDINDDQLIDVISGNRVYIPSCVVINKTDLIDTKAKKIIEDEIKPDLFVCAQKHLNIEELKELIYNKIRFIHIYCKETGKKADMNIPLIMRRGCTIENVCQRLHKDFVRKFKFVKIWGPGAKFPGQEFRKLDKVLVDGDIVEIHLR